MASEDEKTPEPEPVFHQPTPPLSDVELEPGVYTPPPPPAAVHVTEQHVYSFMKSPLDDRDPTRMHDIVKVNFDDIFAEPEGSHSFDSVWTTSQAVFTGTKFWCYRILSLLCAVPLAFCWGCQFGCLTFCYVWNTIPNLKRFLIELVPIGKLWEACIKTCCDPVHDSIARCFGGIVVAIHDKRQI